MLCDQIAVYLLTVDAPDRDRLGRRWLFAIAHEAPTDQIAQFLEFDGVTSELTAAKWDDTARMFSEIAIDFPLPDYFGHNWDALNECLFSESFEGRLVVVRDVTAAAMENFGRFVDLFRFVWLPDPEARAVWPSLFDNRWTPGRVVIVVVGFDRSTVDGTRQDGDTRRYRLQPLEVPPLG
jgi:RNAse (barnase) inhibitor barstar